MINYLVNDYMMTIECGNCGIKKEVRTIDAQSPNNINWSTIWRPLRGGLLFCCDKCKTTVPYADNFEREV
jgi:hypothetical protein